MSEKGFFRHYRLTDGDVIFPQGGATVYYMKQPSCDWHEKENTCEVCVVPTYLVGVSFCSLTDNFKRSTGRAIAEGRFMVSQLTFDAKDRDALNTALLSFVRKKFYSIQDRQERNFFGEIN